MDKDKIAEIADTVMRDSRQPVLDEKTAQSFFGSVYKFAKKAEREEPAYMPDSMIRSNWLRKFVTNEAYLLGVFNTSISLDVNRQFEIVGGRNQVLRFADRLGHSDKGKGWRYLKGVGANDFYGTDMGQVMEIETDGPNGPLLSLYHVDAARCKLTGHDEWPLIYKPQHGKPQTWNKDWFYRITSMPNPAEEYNGLGYCAISRCIKLAQVMIAVMEYDLEKLGHLAPRGILFIQSENMTQEQWNEATAARNQVQVGKTGNEYFDNIMVLVDEAIKGDLMALSKLPDNFDPFEFTDYMMRGYALAFGRDVGTYWQAQRGGLGGDGEATLQYERATRAGIADYATNDQEQIQKLLPPSVYFQYIQDDTRGKILKAELADKWATVGEKLIKIGATTEQVLSKLADEGVIDKDWTEIDEETIVDSTGILRDRLLESKAVQRAVKLYPDEPIIRYSWPDNTEQVVWERGRHAINKSFVVSKPIATLKKQSRQVERANLVNTSVIRDLVDQAINESIEEREFKSELELITSSLYVQQYLLSKNKGTTVNMPDDEYKLYLRAVGRGSNLITDSALPSRVQREFTNLIHEVKASKLADDLYSDKYLDAPASALGNRLLLWDSRVGFAHNLGNLYSYNDKQELEWRVGSTDHCDSCKRNDGVAKSTGDWMKTGIVPQSPSLDCGGWRCQCKLVEVNT